MPGGFPEMSFPSLNLNALILEWGLHLTFRGAVQIHEAMHVSPSSAPATRAVMNPFRL